MTAGLSDFNNVLRVFCMSKTGKPRVFASSEEAAVYFKSGSALAIGNFDGVHFGHRQILKQVLGCSRRYKLKSAVLTFEPHPVHVLSPQVAPKLINTLSQKIEMIGALGVDAVVVQAFDRQLAQKSPEVFFHTHIQKHLGAKHVFVGHDFTFGAKRAGTTETLEQMGLLAEIKTHIVEAQFKKGTLVSSTLIRKLIADGRVELARDYLQRDFFVDGTVVAGHKRGAALGLHTANLFPDNELLPADGVYASFVECAGKIYQSATNIGFNPTFSNTERSIETHLFDFDGNIYNSRIRLHFVKRLRDEIKFVSPEALVMQIKEDILTCRKILTKTKLKRAVK